MVRDRLKKIFTSRIFFAIFSLLASVSVWLYVSYSENDDITQTIRIGIQVLNEDYLTDRELVVTELKPDTVTLRFTGKRNIVTKLTKDNIIASVDLSIIKEKDVKSLSCDIIYPIDINTTSFQTSKSVDYITVAVDNLETTEIPVKGSYDGGVAEDHQAEPMELSPKMIQVSGPQEVVAKISYALVTLQRENLSKTVEEQRPFTLMDASGHEVISDKLTFSHNTINVMLRVLKKKEIPLIINLQHSAGTNELNTSYTITPSTISVSGDADALEEINHITLQPVIDTAQFLNAKTLDFPIVLPDGTKNLTGITVATVTVTISGLESMHVVTDNIAVTNETAGYSATVITKSLDILLRGTADDIKKITPDPKRGGKTDVPVSYRVVADLSELGDTIGTYSVLAKVYVDGDVDVGAVGEYRVTVMISKD